MSAFVEHEFSRGFLLDEERLRKLSDLISARLSKLPHPLNLSYKVYRGDTFSYETASIDTVIAEDNEDWRAITKLELLANDPAVFELKLAFSNKGATVDIEGDDRDAVFLVFSDIREYMNDQVLVFTLSKDAVRAVNVLLPASIALVIMAAMALQIRSDPVKLNAALQSRDALEKLDYLIRDRELGFVGRNSWILVAAMALMVVGPLTERPIRKFLFPSNLFLFGTRRTTFQRRRTMLNNIFWIVIVGLVVSAIAGLLVWKMTG